MLIWVRENDCNLIKSTALFVFNNDFISPSSNKSHKNIYDQANVDNLEVFIN